MKVCFISPASIVHTVRWVNSMAERGHHVDLITMHDVKHDKINPAVTVHKLKIPAPLGYYVNALQVKRLLRVIRPDLVHAHFASGYGTLARLAGYTPTLLSVWGSDVYLFPVSGKRNEKLLKKNLAFADRITSSSYAMRKQTEQFVSPDQLIDVLPFGIDLDMFKPERKQDSDDIVIGTVKRLETVYGIDILIKAVSLLIDKLSESGNVKTAKKIKLEIVGDGSEGHRLEKLADEHGISDITSFAGPVPNEQVPAYLNGFDVYVALSRSESFGVAVLEASACGVPVVVSDVGGLPEVVRNGETGFIAESQNPCDAAIKLYQLIMDKELRIQMGKFGRLFTEHNYDWKANVADMEHIYEEMINCKLKVEE